MRRPCTRRGVADPVDEQAHGLAAHLRSRPPPARSAQRLLLTATVRNAGSTVAAMVGASLRERHSGDRILPAYYSDNYFWLLPGERRQITARWSGRARRAEPELRFDAYNAPAAVG